jgi:hypothetical protein
MHTPSESPARVDIAKPRADQASFATLAQRNEARAVTHITPWASIARATRTKPVTFAPTT